MTISLFSSSETEWIKKKITAETLSHSTYKIIHLCFSFLIRLTRDAQPLRFSHHLLTNSEPKWKNENKNGEANRLPPDWHPVRRLPPENSCRKTLSYSAHSPAHPEWVVGKGCEPLRARFKTLFNQNPDVFQWHHHHIRVCFEPIRGTSFRSCESICVSIFARGLFVYVFL